MALLQLIRVLQKKKKYDIHFHLLKMFNYALYLQSDSKWVYEPKKHHLGLSNLFHLTDFDESNFKTECIFIVFLWRWNKSIRVDFSVLSNELQWIVYIKLWLTLKIIAHFNVDICLEITPARAATSARTQTISDNTATHL